MNILVVNAGSSSLKYQLLDTETDTLLAKGLCERIGIDGRIEHKLPDGRKMAKDAAMPNHAEAMKILVATLTDKEYGCISSMSEIAAVGHRVVHGGSYFSESVIVTDEVIAKLENCRDLAPLHTGPALMGIAGCTEVMRMFLRFLFLIPRSIRPCPSALTPILFLATLQKSIRFAATASTALLTALFLPKCAKFSAKQRALR